MEFQNKQFVLFVGEGDFSYSASFLEKRNSKNQCVFSTCLNPGTLDSKQLENIEIIKHHGGSVQTDVDATELESHPILGQVKFKIIIFNFPHVPKKMNIGQNRKLVELFLKSAEKILDSDGQIHVSLCQGQGGTDAELAVREWHNSWQIVELASRAGLVLCDVWPFRLDSFEKYECTGFRGQSKSFNMKGAVTHVFCRQQLVSSENYLAQKFSVDSLEEWFKSECIDLHRSLSQKLDSPFLRIVDFLTASVKSKFELLNSIFIKNLVSSTCLTLNMEECPQFKNSILCDKCLKILISTFLDNTKNPCDLTTMVNCVCCVHNIDISYCSLTHLVSYFSREKETLMKVLQTVFSSIKESDCIDKNNQVSNWSSYGQSSNLVIDNDEKSHDSNEIVIDEIQSINAFYSIKKNNCCLFYTDLHFLISKNNITPENCFKLGHVINFKHNTKSYFAAFLNVNLLCQLKFHVMDYRILLQKNSYFTTENAKDKTLQHDQPLQKNSYFTTENGNDQPVLMYRSPSLFPASHAHDTSFWVNDDFREIHLFLLVRRTVGSLVKSVKLVEVYRDEPTGRESRCYRFVYQSHGEALPKSVVSTVHSQLRLSIEMSLNVCLR